MGVRMTRRDARKHAGRLSAVLLLAVLGVASPARAAEVTSCADVRAQNAEAPDGIYTIGPDGHVFNVHCVDMDSAPAEYLVLPAGIESNFRFLASRFEPSSTSLSQAPLDP